MLESEWPGGNARFHIEDGVGVNSYLVAFPLGRGLASGGLWNVLSWRVAFLPLPGSAKSFDPTDHFLRLVPAGTTRHEV